MFYALGMSPAEIAQDVDRDASRAIQQQNANRPPSGGGGSGRGPQPTRITVGDQQMYGIYEGNFRYRLPDGRVVTAMPAGSGANTSGSLLNAPVVGGGTARFGGR
jgi:hypothetical protein